MALVDTAADRVLMFCRGPLFSALAQEFAAPWDTYRSICSDILDTYDLDAALTGVALDRLGGILQRPRGTLSDADYRIVLRAQVSLILASTATTETIQNIIDDVSGTAPNWYADMPPMCFQIGLVTPTRATADLITALIGEARAAAYNCSILWSETATPLLCGSTSSLIIGAGVMGSTNGPISGEQDMASVRHV